VTYESMFGSRTIRAPYNHVDSLDEDVESDIRVLRLGRTYNEVARSFALMQGRSPGMEDDDGFTEAHGTGFLAAPASALAAIREADAIFTTCSTSGLNLMQHNPGPFDIILIDESAKATEREALIPLLQISDLILFLFLWGIPISLGLSSSLKYPLRVQFSTLRFWKDCLRAEENRLCR
jgi:hypothetical protein